MSARALVAVALALGAASAGAQTFTLEQALSAPFPTELVAAGVRGAVAWSFDERGARNVWVATPPEYRARRITRFTKDDGQELTELHFTPDGGAVVFVRGGEPNDKGEIPNPALDPHGEEQTIWIAPLAGGAARKLADGSTIAISPKGDALAFVKERQLWTVSLADTTGAHQLLHTRGTADELRWSPDGSKLAFVSRRGDHAFIGVYEAGTETLRYLAPTVDRDGDPVWSPDGKHIAYIRIPTRSRVPVFGARREGEPWSIWIADPATGEGRELWHARRGAGSVFRGIVADDQLFWGAGDRIVFPWEGDGWTHLYSIAASGGDATLLTPGEFEVEHVTIAPDRASIVYSSNQGGVDRRHLWRVSVACASKCALPVAVTTGSGIEWSPVVASDGKAIALLRSDARRPPRPAIIVASAAPRDVAPEAIPADFPSAALVTPQQVIFPAADGLRIHAQLFVPRNLEEGERRPAVVFFHGGSRRQMLLGWHYMQYYTNAYAMNEYLASRGYIVLSVNYRSGIGYGMKFREALNYGATGASEYNDVQGAGLYLRSRSDVDGARIGVWGGSYGGYLTALALARASDLFAAGVDLHGVHDWNLEWESFVPGWDVSRDQAARKIAWESSPMAYEDGWRSPVLLIQGDDDRNVNFSQTVQLAEDLRKRGVSVDQLIFPDEIHDFLLHRDWLAAFHAGSDFFDRTLRGERGVTASDSR